MNLLQKISNNANKTYLNQFTNSLQSFTFGSQDKLHRIIEEIRGEEAVREL